jgi:O-antigen ligase
MSFLGFALLSVFWSDFPFITLKRLIRDLGGYLIVLVVLSDPRPIEAVSITLRKVGYLLIPLSVVLVKYFPAIGTQYDDWTGARAIAGASTSKNMLGVSCLVSGLFFFWDCLTRLSQWKHRRPKRILAINTCLLIMTVWLLHMSASTTSTVCLALGMVILAVGHSRPLRRHPGWLKALIPIGVAFYLLLAFGLNLNGSMAQAVGKDPTLTDRTKIWSYLLSMHTNPILGVGYQSFWLGSRLQDFWDNAHLGFINEAHNGFLQIYLDLGLVGDCLLVIFLVAAYRLICRRLSSNWSFAVFGLTVWVILVLYDMSEAAFGNSLLYTIFLLVGVSVPQPRANRPRRISRESAMTAPVQFTTIGL